MKQLCVIFLLFPVGAYFMKCGETFVKPGFIITPGYPNKYPENSSCFWEIKAPEGQHIKILPHFVSIGEKNNDCKEGYVKYVYDGTAETYCGMQVVGPIHSASNNMEVLFYSVESQKVGFKAPFEFHDQDNTFNITGEMPELQDSLARKGKLQKFSKVLKCLLTALAEIEERVRKNRTSSENQYQLTTPVALHGGDATVAVRVKNTTVTVGAKNSNAFTKKPQDLISKGKSRATSVTETMSDYGYDDLSNTMSDYDYDKPEIKPITASGNPNVSSRTEKSKGTSPTETMSDYGYDDLSNTLSDYDYDKPNKTRNPPSPTRKSKGTSVTDNRRPSTENPNRSSPTDNDYGNPKKNRNPSSLADSSSDYEYDELEKNPNPSSATEESRVAAVTDSMSDYEYKEPKKNPYPFTPTDTMSDYDYNGRKKNPNPYTPTDTMSDYDYKKPKKNPNPFTPTDTMSDYDYKKPKKNPNPFTPTDTMSDYDYKGSKKNPNPFTPTDTMSDYDYNGPKNSMSDYDYNGPKNNPNSFTPTDTMSDYDYNGPKSKQNPNPFTPTDTMSDYDYKGPKKNPNPFTPTDTMSDYDYKGPKSTMSDYDYKGPKKNKKPFLPTDVPCNEEENPEEGAVLRPAEDPEDYIVLTPKGIPEEDIVSRLTRDPEEHIVSTPKKGQPSFPPYFRTTTQKPFRTTPMVVTCGGTVSKEGYIQTPNVSNTKQIKEMHCEWTIQAPSNKVIRVTNEVISTDRTPECTLDYVKFSHGDQTHIFCGVIKNVSFNIHSRSLKIVFHSKMFKSGKEFRALIHFVQDGSNSRNSLLRFSEDKKHRKKITDPCEGQYRVLYNYPRNFVLFRKKVLSDPCVIFKDPEIRKYVPNDSDTIEDTLDALRIRDFTAKMKNLRSKMYRNQ